MSALAREWVDWLVENALRGASREDLSAGLVAGGLPAERAAVEVDDVLSSPILRSAQRLLARSAGIEQVARLRRALDPGPVAEYPAGALDEGTFYRAHWTVQRPVVLRGEALSWPAASWSPATLAERHGSVEISVLVGRSQKKRWWRDREGITRRMPLSELMRIVTSTDGDDVYADGRTDLLDQPGLEALRGELGLLPGLAGDGFPKSWVGPAGTLTPLHHDQSTGWLVQLHGKKRVWLASALEPALLSTTDGVYNTVDPREPQQGELGEVRWHEIELERGDALLLPVGTWHQVLALTPSISVSMGGFRWLNAFPWYTPGRRG